VLNLLAASRDLQTDIQALAFAADRSYSTRTEQIILLAVGMFVSGALLASWLVTRLFAPPLSALDNFEQALVETIQDGVINPIQLPRAIAGQNSPVFQAYNALAIRLRESDASRLDFLTHIVHNLRSPLTAIVGYAELLKNPDLRPADANLESYAGIIAQQAARLAQTIEHMVTTASIVDNHLDLLLRPLRLGPLLAEVVAEAQQRCGREITFEDRLGARLVVGDALRMREVFANLIDNAVKFSAPDTPVEVTLCPARTLGRAEIRVVDHGIGIAEADRPRLFTRFGRLNNARMPGISGSGLGLYIVNQLVERQYGRITVESRPGRGTTFVVTFPLDADSQ
jgi:signal transduction histidine kinase